MAEEYLTRLDRILLSDTACADFFAAYRGGFRDWLSKILPETESCLKQTQNTVWHIYPVLEHILHSVEEINALTKNMPAEDRRLLAYVMFFHDMGKPAAHRVKIVDGKPKDSFAFHALESEKIAARAAPLLGFGEEETRLLAKLVREHDVFLQLNDHPAEQWQKRPTADFLKEYIGELNGYGEGKKLFGFLILIGLSDNRAQNPALTGETLALIERLGVLASSL